MTALGRESLRLGMDNPIDTHTHKALSFREQSLTSLVKVRFVFHVHALWSQIKISASELDQTALQSSLSSRFITLNETIENHCQEEGTTE